MAKPKIDPTLAQAELARRELARRHLIDYATYVADFYQPAKHHRLVAEKLEQVLRYIETGGDHGIGRLMIVEPPRHGKSEEVSRLFPSWLLGKLPDSRVMLTAYGADLANEDSRAVRTYVTSERYEAIFGARSAVDAPVELDPESSAKANWSLAAPHRGGVVSAGIGGGIVGKGAHLLVIDDPFKSREDAASEVYRAKVDSWYKSAAYPRLEKGGAIIIVHTRWDVDDLAGRRLREMVDDPLLADQWEVLHLPAIAFEADEYITDEAKYADKLRRGQYVPQADPLGRKPGEALWPDKYDKARLARIRTAVGEEEWASQYQGMPRKMTGNFFDEGNFKLIDFAPAGLRWYCYIDLALGEKKSSDYNTAMRCALDDKRGVVIYRDLLRIQDLDQFLVALATLMTDPSERKTMWGFESVAFSSLVFRQFARNRKLANVAMVEMTPTADKVTRAQPLRTRCLQGLVEIVRGDWWRRDAWPELESFPGGKHDDVVDTMSGGLDMIAAYGEGGSGATAEAETVTVAEMFGARAPIASLGGNYDD